MKSGRTVSFCMSAVVTGLLGLACASAQVRPRANVPLPPPRPQSLTPAPANPADGPVETLVAAPIAQPAAGPEEPEPSREKLRACSLEWRGMKKSGAAVGLIWRDFSRTCLGRD